MNKIYCLIALIGGISYAAYAQDEGNIVKRERIAREHGIFVGLGPSFTLGKNIGDYSTGINIEVGYTRRLNRIFSIGPSLSFLQFNYDAEKTGINNIFIGGPYNNRPDLGPYYLGAVVNFKGGDLTLTSLAANLKFNFVPVMDNSVFSIYGFAKPFLTLVSRTAVTGTADIYYNTESTSNASDWVFAGSIPYEDSETIGLELSDKLESGTEFTGGIFIGPGVEFFPARKVAFYVQAAFGYTFPLTFVSTESYTGESLDTVSGEFPMAKEGFPSVNIQFGASFNF